MPDYFYDMDLVVDPLNPANVVAKGSVAIYDPADTAGTTLLALKDPSGLPLPNPLTSNANGFLPPRIAGLPQTMWKSGGFTGYFNSYKGLRDEAVSAVAAAQGAADAATTAVAEVVTTAAVDGAGALVLTKANGSTVNAGSVRGPQGVQGPAGQNGTNGLNGSNVLPTAEAIAQAVTTDGPAKTALSATYASKPAKGAVALSMVPKLLGNTNRQNTAAYLQDQVVTVGASQYAAWIDDKYNTVVGKRTLPDGAWSTYDFSKLAGNPLALPTADDDHNVAVLGVDRDGYIHMAANMHQNPMRYVRTTSPGNNASWEAATMTGIGEDKVTYPQFFNAKDGTLLFLFHNDAKHYYLNVYNEATKTWSRRSEPLRAIDGGTAYTNRAAVAPNGDIHLFYIWRDNDVSAGTNHDVNHIVSRDNGVTWQSIQGANLTLPVTVANSPMLMATGNGTLVNQQGADVDTAGRPHAAWFIANTVTGKLELRHFWWDGAWHNDVIFAATYPVSLTNGEHSRTSVFCTNDGRTFIMFRSNLDGRIGSLRVIDVTPGQAKLGEFPLLSIDLGSWEPCFDSRALRDRNELNMLITPSYLYAENPNSAGINSSSWAAQWGALMSVDLSQVSAIAAGQVTLPSILPVASSQAGASVVTSSLTAAGATPPLPVSEHRDKLLVARVVSHAATGGAGTGNLAVSQAAVGASSVDLAAITVSSATPAIISTPWAPVRRDAADLSKGVEVRSSASAVGGTATFRSVSVEVGYVADSRGPVIYTAPRGFQPQNFGALMGWWRPGQNGTTNGAGVSTLTDFSGNGLHLTQGTAGKQPTYRATGINGKPGLQFDGGDILHTAATTVGAVGFTIVAVAASAASTAASQYVLGSDDSGASASRIFSLRYNSTNTIVDAYGFDSPAQAVFDSLTLTNPAAPRILTMTRKPKSVELFVNGVTDGAVTSSNEVFNNATHPIHMGGLVSANGTSDVGFLNGFVGDVLIYKTPLSRQGQQAVEAYLASQFAITLGAI